MNWDAIAAVSDVVGAIVVILSLIYLAKQIKHASRQLENQTENDVYSRISHAYDPVYEGNNGEILWKGLHSPNDLTESEAFVFDLLMDRQVTVLIQTARQVESGMLAENVVNHMAEHYQRVYMDSPGGRQWIEKHDRVLHSSLEALGLK